MICKHPGMQPCDCCEEAQARIAELMEEVAAERRAVARWTHGMQIESDYICHHELGELELRDQCQRLTMRVIVAGRELARITPVYQAACAWHDKDYSVHECCPACNLHDAIDAARASERKGGGE